MKATVAISIVMIVISNGGLLLCMQEGTMIGGITIDNGIRIQHIDDQIKVERAYLILAKEDPEKSARIKGGIQALQKKREELINSRPKL